MKVISGAQTGVDRAALDAAIELGMEHGGWVPRGRFAEDGVIAGKYKVVECDFSDYAVRTELNVKEADATLIICRGPMRGGTQFTHWMCQKHQKIIEIVDLQKTSKEKAWGTLLAFLRKTRPAVLNVAGPRESTCPGIYKEAKTILRKSLAHFLSEAVHAQK